MRPLVLVAAGLVLVAFDVRTEALDLLLDPLGWLLVAAGARRLAITGGMWVAVGAAALSIQEALLPSRFVRINPITGREDPDGTGAEHLAFDLVSGPRLALLVLGVVVGTVALWLLLRELEHRAGRRAAAELRVARRAIVALWAAPYVVVAVIDRDGFDPVWNGTRELLALAGIAALLGTAVVLVRSAGERWAVRPGRAAPDPGR